jgi:hypothetical protein
MWTYVVVKPGTLQNYMSKIKVLAKRALFYH